MVCHKELFFPLYFRHDLPSSLKNTFSKYAVDIKVCMYHLEMNEILSVSEQLSVPNGFTLNLSKLLTLS